MNLEELYKLIKAKALVLINSNGDIVDSFHEDNIYDLKNFSALTKIMVDMVDDFFTQILDLDYSNEIIVKSGNHFFYVLKYNQEHVLCVLAEGLVNISLISLSLKKKMKNE
ncbi:conserved hypothetical protein [Tenacibaculum sediminilitoris]|uniref:hypothetical protein n=1 Tax=Tenacibaculum sediminilitoris TaxID=1820334 RepID=UPI003893B0BC